VIELTRRFATVIRRWPDASATPKTIVHGDFRPDNLLFGRTPEAPPLVVVDWQTVSLSLGVADLAYLLGNGFRPGERAVVERDLVEDYRRRLDADGVDYSADDCWRDYRLGTLHGIVISVIATVVAEQTERGDEMLTLMAQRHGRHALDLDALALLC
jgi:aminoglycoside phosphotransferase (APT) family kinase protein